MAAIRGQTSRSKEGRPARGLKVEVYLSLRESVLTKNRPYLFGIRGAGVAGIGTPARTSKEGGRGLAAKVTNWAISTLCRKSGSGSGQASGGGTLDAV